MTELVHVGVLTKISSTLFIPTVPARALTRSLICMLFSKDVQLSSFPNSEVLFQEMCSRNKTCSANSYCAAKHETWKQKCCLTQKEKKSPKAKHTGIVSNTHSISIPLDNRLFGRHALPLFVLLQIKSLLPNLTVVSCRLERWVVYVCGYDTVCGWCTICVWCSIGKGIRISGPADCQKGTVFLSRKAISGYTFSFMISSFETWNRFRK